MSIIGALDTEDMLVIGALGLVEDVSIIGALDLSEDVSIIGALGFGPMHLF